MNIILDYFDVSLWGDKSDEIYRKPAGSLLVLLYVAITKYAKKWDIPFEVGSFEIICL